MSSFLTKLFIIYFFASSAVLLVIATVICLVTAPFDPNRRLLHYFASAWGYHYILFSPLWHFKIEGKEHIDPNGTYVFVGNHQSYADIFVVYGLFRPFKWVSKEEMFKYPFVGANMQLNQYVCIARGSVSSIKEMMKDCKNWINRKVPVMIFPEGTRSPDGEIHQFRDGAFRIAKDCNVPVVPIVIDGTFKAMSKSATVMNFNVPIRAKVLAPIDPANFENSAKLRDHVRQLMINTLDEMRT